jgi:outer membrane protein assembly factor BamB
MKRRLLAAGFFCILAIALASLHPILSVTLAQGILAWPQWGQNAEHTGTLNVAGQNLNQLLANIVYDPLVPDEMTANGGDLLAHYQTPLVDGNDVFMESKSGTYNVNTYTTEQWHQNKFSWQAGTLVKVWTFDSDWVAPGSAFDFWEPVYHAVLANGFIYDPGAGGTIFRLNRSDGTVEARINPFDDIDGNTYTVSPLTADAAGHIYYNVVRVTGRGRGSFLNADVQDSWLVKVSPDDSVQKVSYSTLLAQATIIGDSVPGAKDACTVQFSASQLPWPPAPDAVPPTTPCGSQRAALNVAPAVAPNGTIYTVSKAHFVTRYNYLIAVNPDLTGKWAASLRGHLHDGCHAAPLPVPSGSVLPKNGDPGGCRVGSPEGVDPGTNEPGPGRVFDDASSSPTIAPDGSILFGALTVYNYEQGHLMRFSPQGQFLGAFGFGWDTTPAIYLHDNSYSIVTKNNHYSGGSYCGVEEFCPSDRTASNPASPEAYFVTQLSPTLAVEWSFQNTNTLSCSRDAQGHVTCQSDHPHGFEWCVNAAVVDKNGVVYANSEDGNLYAINQGGTLKQRIFQQSALGAAYTPASLGSDGKIYSQNSGRLFVVGN